jgi:quercetin dioxygenase-like cupin family protein
MNTFRLTSVAVTMGLLCIVAAQTRAETIAPLLSQDLAGIDGKEGTMLTVEYAPGASSTKHRHNAHVFVYVLEGSVIMQVEGGKVLTLKTGQTFYESPADIHSVSKNASKSRTAKILVFMVKDKAAPPLVPVE